MVEGPKVAGHEAAALLAESTIDLEGNSFARGGVAIYMVSSNGAVAVSSRVDLWQKG